MNQYLVQWCSLPLTDEENFSFYGQMLINEHEKTFSVQGQIEQMLTELQSTEEKIKTKSTV